MSLVDFLSKNFIPVQYGQAFALWLGDLKDNKLPETEWWRLWKGFTGGK